MGGTNQESKGVRKTHLHVQIFNNKLSSHAVQAVNQSGVFTYM